MIYPAGVAPEAVTQIAGLAQWMPPIVYRCDTARYAPGALARPRSNYVLFGSPELGDRGPHSAAAAAVALRAGIDYALQFAYPPIWDPVSHPIDDADFVGHAVHYERHPEDLPVLSWALEPVPLNKVPIRPQTGAYDATVRIGQVNEVGEPIRVAPGITLDQETIKDTEQALSEKIRAGHIQNAWLESLRGREFDLRHPWLAKIHSIRQARVALPFEKFTPKHEATMVLTALKQTQARRILHRAIGDRMMLRLLDEIRVRAPEL